MSRVQLALNVSDLEGSVEFYSKLFGVDPHKRREGYANFEVANPPLKLVLIETSEADRGTGTAGALNHLGVEVDGTDEVSAASARLSGEGLATRDEVDTVCCYATQDKVWVNDPAGAPWEIYTITDDNPASATLASDGGCCTTASDAAREPELITIGAPESATNCC